MKTTHKTDPLFRPYRLNELDLPNRVIMAPMTRAFSPHGVPTTAVAQYYQRRAANGVGLIITEGVGIDRPASVNEPDVPLLHGEAALAGWRGVVDAVHHAGGRVMPQLWHVGEKRSRSAPGWTPPAPYESPSGRSMDGKSGGAPMSEAAIADTIDAFARAASVAERIGFDGVEVHGAHGYLIDQFFHNHLNLRVDRYGGATLMERSQFAIEIVKAVREAVSPGFPVILRLSQWKPNDFTSRLTETPCALEEWLNLFVTAGADALDISERRFGDVAFPQDDPALSLAGWAKKVTGTTIIAVGSVGLAGDTYHSFAGHVSRVAPLDDLLVRLDRDEFDLIEVGRALLQDAAWLAKVREGRWDELRDFSPDALLSLA